MNSLLMKEVLKSGVDRKEFAEFVGLEIMVPTDEMYDLTEQAYTYSGQLYDIYGASDQFEKKAASFLKQRNLLKKGGFTDFGFGEFSYDKFFKYFELLSQQHENELTGLRRQLELLEADQKIAQEQKSGLSAKSTPKAPQVLYAPPPPAPQSQDIRSGNKFQLRSMFVVSGNQVFTGQTPVYPNGHHFPCEEPMWY